MRKKVKHIMSKNGHYWLAYYFILATKIDRLLSDEAYIKLQYRCLFGKKLNLENPLTFCEKLLWLKLYNRRPEYITMVDKYAVKKYVSECIGEEYVIPTLGIWENPKEIEWEKLPDKFVLKCTHDSGGLIICRDKSMFDKELAVKKMYKSLKRDYYLAGREWPYKNVQRRVIAEQYIEVKGSQDLIDYKWYCFNGIPKYCQVIQNRSSKETIDFFDTAWIHQEFIGLNSKAEHAIEIPTRPTNLEKQIEIASKLSKDIPFSRIDLYETNNHIWFGEITFYPAGGLGSFSPQYYNQILGNLIVLPPLKS